LKPYSPKRVLLVDSWERTRIVRAVALRGQKVEVDAAASLSEALIFWRTGKYNLVLLTPRETVQQSVEFFQMIKQEKPGQQVAFLVGAPGYLSFTIPAGFD
jgi:CheY-like chemotaxis protein